MSHTAEGNFSLVLSPGCMSAIPGQLKLIGN